MPQLYSLINMAGDKTFGRKEIRPQCHPRAICLPSQTRRTERKCMEWVNHTLDCYDCQKKSSLHQLSLKDTPVISSKGDLHKACRTSGRFHAAACFSLGGIASLHHAETMPPSNVHQLVCHQPHEEGNTAQQFPYTIIVQGALTN